MPELSQRRVSYWPEERMMSKQQQITFHRIMSLVMVPMMLIMFSVMQIVSKLGYSRRVLIFMGRRMQSPRLKQRAFQGYRATNHDVFVCSYVRSGTNWTMQIAYQIAHRGQGDYQHIHDVVPWPEAPMPRIVRLSDENTYERAPTGLRVIKTHLESNYVPYSPDVPVQGEMSSGAGSPAQWARTASVRKVST